MGFEISSVKVLIAFVSKVVSIDVQVHRMLEFTVGLHTLLVHLRQLIDKVLFGAHLSHCCVAYRKRCQRHRDRLAGR